MLVKGVGHRIPNGGKVFAGPALIDEGTLEELENLAEVAPMHQPLGLAVIKTIRALRPELPQVACFDTAFHRGRASVTDHLGLPEDLFNRGFRRWGFDGLVCESVLDQLKESAPHVAFGRVIIAVLGDSSSLCAVHGGRSVDTTMGFSELDGMPSGTHCGSLDPSLVIRLLHDRPMAEVQDLLRHRSGLLGISGISGDIGVLLASKDFRAADAIDFYVYRTVHEIGALVAELGGLDSLVFTGPYGECCAEIRKRICARLGWLDAAIDQGANERGDRCISLAGRPPSVWIVPGDICRHMAAQTREVVSTLPVSVASR
jgi:acetate kinase